MCVVLTDPQLTEGTGEMPSTLLHFSLLVSILFFALEQFLLFIPTKVKVKTLHFPQSWGPRSHPWHLS